MLGAVVVDHLVLTAAGLWPRSQLLGPNWTRLPGEAAASRQVAITIDDGPDPQITPQVLALLQEHSVRATFFCIGERVERHKELAREIVRQGHAIENHSQRHLHRFSVLGPRAMAAEIARAQQTILERHGRVAAVLPCAGRTAQSISRARAGAARSAACELDAARLRYRQRDPQARAARLLASAWGWRHSAAARRSCRLDSERHSGHLEVLPRLLEALCAARLTPVTLRAAIGGTA